MLTEATRQNLERKASYADNLQIVNGIPLFSWLDLSITELCNRSAGSPNACVFCPRIDAGFYPNQSLHMSVHLAAMMAEELKELHYKGAVVLCGFGEPLLHPKLEDFVRPFKGLRVEIVTNGDRLNQAKIDNLLNAGVSYFVVSMYDGPHQVDIFDKMFKGHGSDKYILRDRWYDERHDFGLKLTNRAGTIEAGHQPEPDPEALCYYPSYSMAVDWNGDVLLCVQDWNKRLRFANLNNVGLVEAWQAKALHKRRVQLAYKGRLQSPCSECNANGCLHGEEHAKAWLYNTEK